MSQDNKPKVQPDDSKELDQAKAELEKLKAEMEAMKAEQEKLQRAANNESEPLQVLPKNANDTVITLY